jgi:hypothetical protein
LVDVLAATGRSRPWLYQQLHDLEAEQAVSVVPETYPRTWAIGA